MFTRAYELFRREESRVARREELYQDIQYRIRETFPKDNGGNEHGRPGPAAARVLEKVPDLIRQVEDIPSLEMFLSFLTSLTREFKYSDLYEFAELAGIRDASTEVSGRFLYAMHLAVTPESLGTFDTSDGVRGLQRYLHLEGVLCGEQSYEAAAALIKAARDLGTSELFGTFTTNSGFLHREDEFRLGYFLRDDELATLVATNPDRVDEIIDALKIRGTFPGAKATLEIINSDSKALSDGML